VTASDAARRLPPLDGARGWLTGLGATALLLVAFPPAGLWPLAVPAVAGLALFAHDAPRGRAAFGRLAACGLLYFGVGSAWIAEVQWINLVAVVLVEAFWLGVLGWSLHRGLRRAAPWPALPLLWVANELLRQELPLSGYPWQLVGHAGAANAVLVQCADVAGAFAITFVLAGAAAPVLGWLLGRPGGLRAALVVLALAVAYGLVRPRTLGAPEPGPRLAAVQPGFHSSLREPPPPPGQRLDRLVAMTRQVLDPEPAAVPVATALDGPPDRPPDLVVWPETVWPGLLEVGPGARPSEEERRLVRAILRAPDGEPAAARLLAGATTVRRAGERVLHANSAVYWDGHGERRARYDKVKLVPGAETLPYGDLLPEGARRAIVAWIDEHAGFVLDLEPGPGPRLMELDGTPFGVTICYDNAYGGYVRRLARRGARFLVNLSNESWYGTSTEHDHMELHSRLRAVESRRALFRATTSGISGLARPDGRPMERLVVDGSDRGVAGLFVADVPVYDDPSPYALWGDAPAWLCVLLGAGLVLRRRSPRGGRNRLS